MIIIIVQKPNSNTSPTKSHPDNVTISVKNNANARFDIFIILNFDF